MSGWPWLLTGGALAYAWHEQTQARDRARVSSSRATSASAPPAARSSATVAPSAVSYVWPVPLWGARRPAISNPFQAQHHNGVDLMFVRLPSDSALTAGSPNGSKGFVMPTGMHAVAAGDGVVWSAGNSSRGHSVVIAHADGRATFYQHLETLLVTETSNGKAGEYVRAGQPLGVIGANPQDTEGLKHLHFEIWPGGVGAFKTAIDPAPLLATWAVVADPSVNASALVARNAGFVYRPVGASAEPYPAWVRALKGKSGAYVIRDRETRAILYVGSSRGRLYGTLTRHFQGWARSKKIWSGSFGAGHDPGLTYDRESVEVAVRITSDTRALDEETRLIARLKPADNLTAFPNGERPDALEEAPF